MTMQRHTLSLPLTRWEQADTRTSAQLLRDGRIVVRPSERLAATVATYLRSIHKPLTRHTK